MRRFLSLDYVLEHPHLPWLPTEPEKVDAFEGIGVERRLLPQRVYRGAAGSARRYFPLQLPVALDAERAVFVYVDPGHETATALRSWGTAHRELWKALWDRGLRIEVVAVARTWKELSRARTVLANWTRDPRPCARIPIKCPSRKQVVVNKRLTDSTGNLAGFRSSKAAGSCRSTFITPGPPRSPPQQVLPEVPPARIARESQARLVLEPSGYSQGRSM